MTDGGVQDGVEYVTLEAGDPAPHFAQRCIGGEFNLGNLGGNFAVLAFFPSSSVGAGKAVLDIVRERAAIFEGGTARFVAITVDRNDETRLKAASGFDVILDFDGNAGRRYGAVPGKVPAGATHVQFRPRLVLLDRRLRVAANIELRPDGSDAGRIAQLVDSIPGLAAAEPELTPPVLIVPGVFPPEFCRALIGLFEAAPRPETGVVRQSRDKSSLVLDGNFKRRRDYGIEDAALVTTLKEMLRRRLLPEIAKAFQFQATHVERHIVCRYSAEEQGHFRAHRDNHALGTAHRRFAATINLNREFEGGTLSFPEFGAQRFNAPPGGAVVFSCSLLHAVSPVTRGLRYVYLPFFYDDAAAEVLEANRASWTDDPFGPGIEVLTRF